MQTGEWFALPQNDVEICGIRCGGRSGLNVHRAENTSLDSDCCTATDVESLRVKMQGPCCVRHQLYVENVVGFMAEDAKSAGFSFDFAEMLDDLGFTFVARYVQAEERGGCQRRARFVGLAVRRCQEMGCALLILMSCFPQCAHCLAS